MTGKPRRSMTLAAGFKYPAAYRFHYDGSVRKKGSVERSLLHSVATSSYRLERRLRRGATTMKARHTQPTDRDGQSRENNDRNVGTTYYVLRTLLKLVGVNKSNNGSVAVSQRGRFA